MNSMDVFLRRAKAALDRPKDDCLTVVFRGLTSDEKREIINRHEAVHLRHGNGLEERKELDRIAIALQAEIEALRAEVERDKALLQQALEFCEFAWRDVPMNEYAFERLEQTIAALRERLGVKEQACKQSA